MSLPLYKISSQSAVGEIVSNFPTTRQILEEHDVDYCCGGARSLQDAASRAGAALEPLLQALQAAIAKASSAGEAAQPSWAAAPLTKLVNHIEYQHHSYTREALPRVEKLLAKVLRAHGEHHGVMLGQLQTLFLALQAELLPHLQQEEQLLFPHIRQLEMARLRRTAPPEICCGSIKNPIRQMETEHESAGETLSAMRKLSDGYAPPADACPTFIALYDALRELEDDLHEHIHLENNILFPRALAMAGDAP
jgi:regulator of cell morphogenesis and NO signaling